MDTKRIIPNDWIICKELKLGDVWIKQSDGLEYFVFDIIKQDLCHFIYFSSFDFKKRFSGILINYNDLNYFRILNIEDEQKLSFQLLKNYLLAGDKE